MRCLVNDEAAVHDCVCVRRNKQSTAGRFGKISDSLFDVRFGAYGSRLDLERTWRRYSLE